MGNYSKLIVALVGGLVTWGGTYYANNHWFQLLTVLLTAGGVWAADNTPTSPTPPPA